MKEFNNTINEILNDEINGDIILKLEKEKERERHICLEEKKIMQKIAKKFYDVYKKLNGKWEKNREYEIMFKKGFFALLFSYNTKLSKYGRHYNCECTGFVVYNEKNINTCYVDLENIFIVKEWYFKLKHLLVNRITSDEEKLMKNNDYKEGFNKILLEQMENW